MILREPNRAIGIPNKNLNFGVSDEREIANAGMLTESWRQ